MDPTQQERLRVNFSWLIRLRWAAAGGQLATIAAARSVFEVEFPLAPMLALVAVTVLTNAILELGFRGRGGVTWLESGELLAGSIMVFDLLLLSAMLYTAGGIANPFAIFLLVNLALAAVILRAPWSWGLTALAAVCCAALALWHQPLEALGDAHALDPSVLMIGAGRDPGDLRLTGQLVALIAAGGIVVYFITRLSLELRSREADLSRERASHERDQRLAALATLAAGAAHELSSPLGTIAVVARELERALERDGAASSAVEDARLIRTEVGRCRAILECMAADAGASIGDLVSSVEPEALIEETLEGFGHVERVSFHIEEAARAAVVRLPLRAVAQTLRALINNAVDASEPDGRVEVRISRREATLAIEVIDRGTGMSEETLQRACEPFFTTKEPGRGTGLGLYLGRTVIERLEGTLTLQSALGQGTRATVELPLAKDESSP
jgi:two-component system sensor histidine kinase RegB